MQHLTGVVNILKCSFRLTKEIHHIISFFLIPFSNTIRCQRASVDDSLKQLVFVLPTFTIYLVQ